MNELYGLQISNFEYESSHIYIGHLFNVLQMDIENSLLAHYILTKYFSIMNFWIACIRIQFLLSTKLYATFIFIIKIHHPAGLFNLNLEKVPIAFVCLFNFI